MKMDIRFAEVESTLFDFMEKDQLQHSEEKTEEKENSYKENFKEKLSENIFTVSVDELFSAENDLLDNPSNIEQHFIGDEKYEDETDEDEDESEDASEDSSETESVEIQERDMELHCQTQPTSQEVVRAYIL